jgi:hypothetical protein
MLKGAIISGLGFFRKTTSRELPGFQMIRDALAAEPLSFTGVIGTPTPLQILFLSTVHFLTSLRPYEGCKSISFHI